VFDDARALLAPYCQWMSAWSGGGAEAVVAEALMTQLDAYRNNRHWSPDAPGTVTVARHLIRICVARLIIFSRSATRNY